MFKDSTSDHVGVESWKKVWTLTRYLFSWKVGFSGWNVSLLRLKSRLFSWKKVPFQCMYIPSPRISVADLDPGSSAFLNLDPESGSVMEKVPICSRNEHPGSYFWELSNIFLRWKNLNSLFRIRGPVPLWPWSRDPGWKIQIGDINILDPHRCLEFRWMSQGL
jgi:hypothetical protein